MAVNVVVVEAAAPAKQRAHVVREEPNCCAKRVRFVIIRHPFKINES